MRPSRCNCGHVETFLLRLNQLQARRWNPVCSCLRRVTSATMLQSQVHVGKRYHRHLLLLTCKTPMFRVWCLGLLLCSFSESCSPACCESVSCVALRLRLVSVMHQFCCSKNILWHRKCGFDSFDKVSVKLQLEDAVHDPGGGHSSAETWLCDRAKWVTEWVG